MFADAIMPRYIYFMRFAYVSPFTGRCLSPRISASDDLFQVSIEGALPFPFTSIQTCTETYTNGGYNARLVQAKFVRRMKRHILIADPIKFSRSRFF